MKDKKPEDEESVYILMLLLVHVAFIAYILRPA